MNAVRLLSLPLLLAACLDVPSSAVPMPEREARAVWATVDAWRARGYRLDEKAEQRLRGARYVAADDTTMAERCWYPPPRTWACTRIVVPVLGDSFAVFYVSSRVSQPERALGEPVIHETIHVLAPGLLGHQDPGHQDVRLWKAWGPNTVQVEAEQRFSGR